MKSDTERQTKQQLTVWQGADFLDVWPVELWPHEQQGFTLWWLVLCCFGLSWTLGSWIWVTGPPFWSESPWFWVLLASSASSAVFNRRPSGGRSSTAAMKNTEPGPQKNMLPSPQLSPKFFLNSSGPVGNSQPLNCSNPSPPQSERERES